MAYGLYTGYQQLGPNFFWSPTSWYWTQPDPITPSAPPTTPQQTIPSSKYGQTIPVIFGKARVPSAYIWAAPIDTDIDGENISVILTARLRFAAPLEANSTWALRRLWADGKLVYDASQGFRAESITYLKAYDGRSTQGRDPVMVEVEGEDEVSAHRSYLDVVITMNLGAQANQPPAFDGEWVQGAGISFETEAFDAFSSVEVNTTPSMNFATGRWYGYSTSTGLIRHFQIGTLREIYSVALTEIVRAYDFIDERSFRYVSAAGRIIAFAGTGGGDWYGVTIHPQSGNILAEADEGMSVAINQTCHVRFSNASIVIGSEVGSERVFITRFLGDSLVERTYVSAASWQGYSAIRSMAPGEVRDDDADIWVCADDELVKVVVSSLGTIVSIDTHATLSDEIVYAVVHDGDIICWTDAATIVRVNGDTGSTVWTETVPYQIEALAAANRHVAEPDMLRLSDKFLFVESTAYNFTNLNDGSTESVAVASFSPSDYAFDGVRNWMVRSDNGSEPIRTIFDMVGEGTTRNLSDFYTAIMTHKETYSDAEVQVIGVADQIQGGIIDVTIGVRECARSVNGPYAVAMFERAGEVILKRADTDGAFAVNATFSSNDFVDQGGQAIRARRLNPEEFVARYGITYRDPDEVYTPRTQYGEIQFTPFPVSPTDLSAKVDAPVIASATVIKTLATKRVQKMAEERHEFSWTNRARYLDLEPEDVLQFSFAGRTVIARSMETTINPDFTIAVKATEFLSKVDTTVTGASGTPWVPGQVGDPASEYYHLDIPLQAASDDLASTGLVQYHVLTSQGQDNWDGATLFVRSTGLYAPAASQTEDGLVGVALSALPDTDNPYVTEFTRTINVGILTGDTSPLTTKTYLEVMNGANKFAIGAPGRWEVCHVITITDNGNGSFAFTGLVRGRGVSEEHTGTHQAGDYVVWLSGDNVQHLDYGLDSLGDLYSYKAVGFGGNITTTPATSATVAGEAEKIPKPAQLDVVRDGTKLVFSWQRCARYGVIWADDGDDTFSTPLGETLEQYVLRVLDGPGGTVLRTFTVDDAMEQDYTDAEQTTDFGSTVDAGEDLSFDIRQVSGAGVISPTREATITL